MKVTERTIAVSLVIIVGAYLAIILQPWATAKEKTYVVPVPEGYFEQNPEGQIELLHRWNLFQSSALEFTVNDLLYHGFQFDHSLILMRKTVSTYATITWVGQTGGAIMFAEAFYGVPLNQLFMNNRFSLSEGEGRLTIFGEKSNLEAISLCVCYLVIWWFLIWINKFLFK